MDLTFEENEDIIWKVSTRLGKGGFSNVYHGVCSTTKKEVALKVANKSKSSTSLVKNEVNCLKKVKHENIVSYYGNFACQVSGIRVIKLELCASVSLRDCLEKNTKFEETQVITLIRQLIKTFQYLHDECLIVHRDLKPGNILFARDAVSEQGVIDFEKIRVCDFGLAQVLTYKSERMEKACGTPNYVSPEMVKVMQHFGGGYDYGLSCDVWAIGCITYACLFQKPPFETTSVDTTYKRISSIIFYFPERIPISKNAKDFISSILKFEEERSSLESLSNHPFLSSKAANATNNVCENLVSSDATNNVCANYVCANEPLAFDKPKRKRRRIQVMKSVSQILQTKPMVCRKEDVNFLLKEKVWIKHFFYDQKYGLIYETCEGEFGAWFNDFTVCMMDTNKEGIFDYFWGTAKRTEVGKQTDSDSEKKAKICRYALKNLDRWEKNVGPERQHFYFNGTNHENRLRKFVCKDGVINFRFYGDLVQTVFKDGTTIFFSGDGKSFILSDKQTNAEFLQTWETKVKCLSFVFTQSGDQAKETDEFVDMSIAQKFLELDNIWKK